MSTTATITISINGGPPLPGSLTTRCVPIDIPPSIHGVADPSWEITDPAGHYHAFTDDRQLPTLVAKAEPTPCDGVACEYDEDGTHLDHSVTRRHCRICDAVIEPRYVQQTWQERVAGPLEWEATVESDKPLSFSRLISVVIDVQASDGWVRYFGIGKATSVEGTGHSWVTTIIGDGDLGRRVVRHKRKADPLAEIRRAVAVEIAAACDAEAERCTGGVVDGLRIAAGIAEKHTGTGGGTDG